MVPCTCTARHQTRRIVLTGGPGAGKTATLELIRQSFCEHVQILPEAAGVVFGGGFPRRDTADGRKAAQRAIFYLQRELEAAAIADNAAILKIASPACPSRRAGPAPRPPAPARP